jgi:hypothetical protein
MGDMKAAARTAMAAKLISDVVTGAHRPVKADLLADMLDAGVERVRVTDDDGNNLGAVSLAVGKPRAKVVDDRAFTAWVIERYPAEVVTAIREAFAKKLLDGATAAGDPVDPSTGEPYLTVRAAAGAVDRMRETLVERGLLQLAGGTE